MEHRATAVLRHDEDSSEGGWSVVDQPGVVELVEKLQCQVAHLEQQLQRKADMDFVAASTAELRASLSCEVSDKFTQCSDEIRRVEEQVSLPPQRYDIEGLAKLINCQQPPEGQKGEHGQLLRQWAAEVDSFVGQTHSHALESIAQELHTILGALGELANSRHELLRRSNDQPALLLPKEFTRKDRDAWKDVHGFSSPASAVGVTQSGDVAFALVTQADALQFSLGSWHHSCVEKTENTQFGFVAGVMSSMRT